MRPRHGARQTAWRRLAAAVAGLGLVLAACGSGGGKAKSASGTKLAAETASYDVAAGPPTRYMVGLFTGDKRGISYGSIQVRFCFLGAAKATLPCRYGAASTASFLTIPGSPPPPAGTTSPQIVSSAESKGVYATDAAFDQAGFWRTEVTAEVGGARQQTTTDFPVLPRHLVPAPGDAAIPSQTLTLSTPNTPPAAVDSRASAGGLVPDPDLHQTTITAALAARRPVVVVFSTPVFCVSRFCGPITDMVDGVAKRYTDRATFIHVEIWRDYQNQQVNQAALDWLYRDNNLSEPWVFLVGADGKIAARWDNVATQDEVEAAVRNLPVIGP